MSHDTPVIKAATRDRTGTKYARRLRAEGRLPAVIYGHQTKPVSVSVDAKEALGHLHHGSHVMNVEVEGGSTETCLVKDLQFGFLGDNVTHIDFVRVDLNEEVTVNVHLTFFGEPAAAKETGAVMRTHINELEVICRVTDIPDDIRVDLTKMEGSALTVGELELPANVKPVADANSPVVDVTIVAEEAEGEEVELGDGSEPEVIGASDEAGDGGSEG